MRCLQNVIYLTFPRYNPVVFFQTYHSVTSLHFLNTVIMLIKYVSYKQFYHLFFFRSHVCLPIRM